jgi:hypothetical protein
LRCNSTESPLSPHDWGTRQPKTDPGYAASISGIRELIVRYRPDVVVIEDASEGGIRRSSRLPVIHQAVMRLGETFSFDVVKIKRQDVHSCFARQGALTKHEIASLIAKEIEAFAPLLPEPRRAWQSQDKRMHVFDAAARALTYYYRAQN